MKEKPNLSFWGLWNLSFGFFGVQIAYALQSANISRIFATLGADPHSLSYFWILPPLMGIIVQPIVGTCSDKTWCRFGRRIPYLFIGAAIAVLVMCLLPNSGSFGMTVSTAMTFGLIALMFLDTSINMAMQPFKMLVGDMVNEKQKAAAYSIQSFLCNAGSLVGYVFPFVFALLGIANTAPKGVVPDSVIYSFYVGAAILILCVIYTVAKVKEWNPKEYEEYNGVKEDVKEEEKGSGNWLTLLKNAFAVQAIGSVIWAPILPKFTNRKVAYAVSLLLGGIGFASCAFIHDQYLLFIPFLLIGCAWAAMLAMPFTFVTNALQGYGHMGAYLGLFNGTICIPQIVAAAIGGTLLALVGSVQSHMMIVAGVALVLGALSVSAIKEK